jgi:hypothetical protein
MTLEDLIKFRADSRAAIAAIEADIIAKEKEHARSVSPLPLNGKVKWLHVAAQRRGILTDVQTVERDGLPDVLRYTITTVKADGSHGTPVVCYNNKNNIEPDNGL